MATDIHHAQSSARRWGGTAEDYLAVHKWFDATKTSMPDYRHRALRHHAEVFGDLLTLGDGRKVPVRWIAEQHVKEDLGRIPTAADWLRCLQGESWMMTGARAFAKTVSLE